MTELTLRETIFVTFCSMVIVGFIIGGILKDLPLISFIIILAICVYSTGFLTAWFAEQVKRYG